MKIEGWEIQKYKQISPNESCHLTLPPRPYALCPVSRALWVSHFPWLDLGFVKQEEAISAHRGRSTQLEKGLTEHTLHAHEKSAAHQCRNQTCLIYIQTVVTWLSQHTWWLHWLGKLSRNQLTSTSKRRAEEDSCVACHVHPSSKSSAQIYLEQMFWGMKKADLANSLLLCIISESVLL